MAISARVRPRDGGTINGALSAAPQISEHGDFDDAAFHDATFHDATPQIIAGVAELAC